MTDKLINLFNSLNPIIQGALGSALFAFILWFLRFLFLRITDNIKKVKYHRDTNEIKRYLIRNKYINSNGLYYFTQGYLFVISYAIEKIIIALIILIFGSLLRHIVEKSFITDFIFGGLAIYILFDAYRWFRPKLRKGDLTNYDQKIVSEIKDQLLDDRLKDRDKKLLIKQKETEIERLKSQINNLNDQILGKE